jgi:hypothetical protein
MKLKTLAGLMVDTHRFIAAGKKILTVHHTLCRLGSIERQRSDHM